MEEEDILMLCIPPLFFSSVYSFEAGKKDVFEWRFVCWFFGLGNRTRHTIATEQWTAGMRNDVTWPFVYCALRACTSQQFKYLGFSILCWAHRPVIPNQRQHTKLVRQSASMGISPSTNRHTMSLGDSFASDPYWKWDHGMAFFFWRNCESVCWCAHLSPLTWYEEENRILWIGIPLVPSHHESRPNMFYQSYRRVQSGEFHLNTGRGYESFPFFDKRYWFSFSILFLPRVCFRSIVLKGPSLRYLGFPIFWPSI